MFSTSKKANLSHHQRYPHTIWSISAKSGERKWKIRKISIGLGFVQRQNSIRGYKGKISFVCFSLHIRKAIWIKFICAFQSPRTTSSTHASTNVFLWRNYRVTIFCQGLLCDSELEWSAICVRKFPINIFVLRNSFIFQQKTC